jgi:hypothetical protein
VVKKNNAVGKNVHLLDHGRDLAATNANLGILEVT